MTAAAILVQAFAAIGCTILMLTVVSLFGNGYIAGIGCGLIVNVYIWGFAYLIGWFIIRQQRSAERNRHLEEAKYLDRILRYE